MSFTKRAAVVLATAAAAATISAGAASAAPATEVHGHHGQHSKQFKGGKHHGWKKPSLGQRIGYLIDHPDRAAKYLDHRIKHLLKHGSA